MPLEPKKPIEELLEASAKARREQFGADLKMPNPMRARLHDEIVRLARSDEPETRSPWLRMWWPRLIVGAAAAALAIGGPLIWWRAQQPAGGSLRLATNQPAAAGGTNQLEDQSLPERAGSSAVSAEPKSMDLAKTADKNLPAVEKFAEVAITPSASAPMAEGQPAEEKDVARLSAAPPASAAFARSGKTEASNLGQQFSQSLARQAFRRNAKEKQATKVLNTFEIEQDGDQIR